MAAIGIHILGGGGMDKAHAVDINQIIAAALAYSETETDRTWQRSENLKGYST